MKRRPNVIDLEIEVRESTYEKLKAFAKANREHVSQALDDIINRYLDQKEKQ